MTPSPLLSLSTSLDAAGLDLAGMTLVTVCSAASFGGLLFWRLVDHPRRVELRRRLELVSASQRRGKRENEDLAEALQRRAEEVSELQQRCEKAEAQAAELNALEQRLAELAAAGPGPELLAGIERLSAELGAHDDATAERLQQLGSGLEQRLEQGLGEQLAGLGQDLSALAAASGEQLELEREALRGRALAAEQRADALAASERALEARMRERLTAIQHQLESVDADLARGAGEREATPPPAQAVEQDAAAEPRAAIPEIRSKDLAVEAPQATAPPEQSVEQRPQEGPEEGPKEGTTQSVAPTPEPPAALPADTELTAGRRPGELLALLDALEAERAPQRRSAILRELERSVAEARADLLRGQRTD